MNRPSSIFIAIAIVLVTTLTASAATFEKYRILKISAPDARAVVKNPDGSLRVIAPGDMVDGAQVSEIVEGRVVLAGQDGETIIVRFENNRQRIETLQRFIGPSPTMTAPGVASE